MANVRRLFGLATDAVVGGSSYDDLTAGAIPDATLFWPVTGGTLDKNLERIGREDEVRGRRPAAPPAAFRASPVMTIPVRAYLSVVAIALKRTLGGADTLTGAMSPYTHAIGVLGYGNVNLPASHVQLVRDDLNHKMSGAAFNRTSLTFPLDGEGTAEVELWGKYHMQDAAAPPTSVFTGESPDVLMLRDAEVFIDGAGTAIPNLEGFEFSFVNNIARHWAAKRNVVTRVLGTGPQTRKTWFPGENRLGASQDVTYALNFGSTDTAQDLAEDFAQVQKFVFDVVGAPITGGTEILRITIYAGEHSGTGGADALSARDDITSRYEGGAFYSNADTADIKVEVVNGSATLLA